MTTASQPMKAKHFKTERLPSLPQVLVNLLDASHSQTASFQELAQIVNQDSAITTRVIALANSSYYKRGNEINSVERAILVLGTDTLRTIAITASIQQFYSKFNIQDAEFLKRFWLHSLASAQIAKALALLTSYPQPDEAYLAGMLHNVGELVLSVNFGEQYLSIKHPGATKAEVIDDEETLCGIHHAALGAQLTRQWQLNPEVSEAIEFHHSPINDIVDAQHLIKLIYIAGRLAELIVINAETGQALESLLTDFDEGNLLFELNSGLILEITKKIQANVIETAESLNIKLNSQAEDQTSQLKLARSIRDLSLTQTNTSGLNQAENLGDLAQAFATSVSLLFGYHNTLLFWCDNDKKSLVSIGAANETNHHDFTIKLDAQRNSISKAAIDNTIICTEYSEHPKPVIEQQILRRMSSDKLICAPLNGEDSILGVLVIGVSGAATISENVLGRIKQFTEEALATSYKSLMSIKDASQGNTETMQIRAQEIAHEANNPLNIINNYLVSLSKKIDTFDHSNNDKQALQEELQILQEEVSRTSRIISRLNDLKHESKEQLGQLDVNLEIQKLVTLYQRSLFLINDLTVTLALDAELPVIQGNKNQFKQIITNLVKNAAEALPAKGRITLSTTANIKVNGSDFVEIIIEDNGPGIAGDIYKNLFTPVASTKGDKHSGLGLSITKNLVTDAKGTISCRSNALGTSFQILLPQVEVARSNQDVSRNGGV